MNRERKGLTPLTCCSPLFDPSTLLSPTSSGALLLTEEGPALPARDNPLAPAPPPRRETLEDLLTDDPVTERGRAIGRAAPFAEGGADGGGGGGGGEEEEEGESTILTDSRADSSKGDGIDGAT